jgi:hypothetical protein
MHLPWHFPEPLSTGDAKKKEGFLRLLIWAKPVELKILTTGSATPVSPSIAVMSVLACIAQTGVGG